MTHNDKIIINLIKDGRIYVDGESGHVGRKDGIRDRRGRFGKKAAGRLMDGREWNQLPEGEQ